MSQQVTNDVEIILSEPQTSVLEVRTPVILDMAGQGSGKSQNIGYSSGMFVTDFPQTRGFIGANTYLQLSQSTLVAVFKTWKEVYGYEEYDVKARPGGAFVVDKKPPPHFHRIHHLRKYDGTISFYNGAIIFLGSLDNYKAHDGKEFGWAHLDETKDTDENALKEVIIGRLRQFGIWYDREGNVFYDDTINEAESVRRGWTAWNPLYIHTSPALGGVQWLNEMFQLDKFEKDIKREVLKEEKGYFFKQFDNKTVVIYSAYHNAPNLPPNYIENQKLNLRDEGKIMKLVYGYPFSKSGGEWFTEFKRSYHVQPVQYVKGEPVHITWDFNVVPYMTCLCCQIRFIMRYIDEAGNKYDTPRIGLKPFEVMRFNFFREYCLESPHNSTEAVCEHLAQDFDANETEMFYYGDASGLSRIPGMGSLTNFKIVEDNLYQFLSSASKRVKAPNVGPLTRRDLVNDILQGKKHPEVEVFFDEDMAKTIGDLEHVKLGPKGKVKEKVKDENGNPYEKNGHTSDALEYLITEICKGFLS